MSAVAAPAGPAADPEQLPGDAEGLPGRGPSTVGRINGGLLRGERLALLVVILTPLVTWYAPQIVSHRSAYRHYWLEWTAYGLVAGVLAVCAVFVARDASLGPVRWPLLAVLFVASVLEYRAVRPAAVMGPAECLFTAVGWFAVLLLESLPPVAVVVVIAAFDVVVVALRALVPGDRNPVVALTMSLVFLLALQFVAAYSLVALRRIEDQAARDADREERLRIAQAVTEQVRRERQAMYAVLRRTTLPLLLAMVHGTGDPQDEGFRRACAIESARLRRLFAEQDDTRDPMLHELRSCIGVAERNGVRVSVAAQGDRPDVPLPVRRALLDPISAVLAASTSSARITLTPKEGAIQLSVVATVPRDQLRPVVDDVREPTGNVTIELMTMEDKLWVQASWRPPDASRS